MKAMLTSDREKKQDRILNLSSLFFERLYLTDQSWKAEIHHGEVSFEFDIQQTFTLDQVASSYSVSLSICNKRTVSSPPSPPS